MNAIEELLSRSGFRKWDKSLFVKILVDRKGNYRGGSLRFYLPGYDGELYDRYIFYVKNKNGVIRVQYIDMVDNDLNEDFIVSSAFEAYEFYEKCWNNIVEDIRKNVRKTTTN